jgi:hypothetical protein
MLADYTGYSSVFLIGGLAATLGLWMTAGVRGTARSTLA